MDAWEPIEPIPGFDRERCRLYLDGNEGAPPRDLLLLALSLVRPETEGAPRRRALDIGCGPGREALELLRAGFDVEAFDPYPVMVERTRAGAAALGPDVIARLDLRVATLERMAPMLAADRYDLIHAGFVLPFVRPSEFDRCLSAIRSALAAGGVLAAQFFGPDDEFIRGAAPGTMTAHAADEVGRALSGLEILHRDEVNRSGRIGRGREKWWHVHHVVARKPG